jgi:hypothetical protein
MSVSGMLVAGYAIAVMAVDQLVVTGAIPLDSLASSPVGLLHGRLWTMLSSGLVTAGDLPLLQTGVLAGVLVAFAARHGGWLVVRTALAAHVGSALIAYAGLLFLTGTGIARDQPDLLSPDYGTSCVWFGCVAGLVAIELMALRRRPLAASLVLAVGTLLVVATGPLSADPLTTAEHLLALTIGAIVGASAGRQRPLQRRRLADEPAPIPQSRPRINDRCGAGSLG